VTDRILTVTIPGTPDRVLSPNAVRKTHWGTRRRATEQARTTAYCACRDANLEMWEPDPPLTLHAVIAWEKGRRQLDPDNAHGILKATIDGVADALGVDDKHLTLASVTQTRDEAGRGFVRVAIEAAPEGDGQ
jgi:crossover junction endodeoxyribonuclease RusA